MHVIVLLRRSSFTLVFTGANTFHPFFHCLALYWLKWHGRAAHQFTSTRSPICCTPVPLLMFCVINPKSTMSIWVPLVSVWPQNNLPKVDKDMSSFVNQPQKDLPQILALHKAMQGAKYIHCKISYRPQATREAKPLQLLVERASNPKSWIPCIEDVHNRSWPL